MQLLFYEQAMKVVSDRQNKEATAKQQKEKELSKVKINKEDVDLIVIVYFSFKMLHKIKN